MDNQINQTKKVLFIGDALNLMNPKKDSTLALMVAFFKEQCEVYYVEPQHLTSKYISNIKYITFKEYVDASWLAQVHQEEVYFNWGIDAIVDECKNVNNSNNSLTDFDIILERTDPPFNMEYFYRQLLLNRVASENPQVQFINHPLAILTHNEKLAILEFGEHTPKTLVAKEITTLKNFWEQQIQNDFDVIFKPLDGMGGQGIFRAGSNEKNINAILEVLTKDNTETIMAQQFIPAVTQGDKRILIIDGVPVDYAVHRMAATGETRSNLAKGGHAVVQEISEKNRQIAQEVGEKLKNRGLFLIGLDMIGDKITEINVTSPTCFREIMAQKNMDIAGLLVQKILQKN